MTTSRVADDGDRGISTAVEYRLSELKVSVDGDEYSVPLDREVVRIGRGKGNDIVLEDPDLSFVHCEIWAQRDHYVLIDNDTEDGTFVNGKEVEFCVLEPGDEIQVGDAVLLPVEASREETPEPLEPDEAEALFSERSDHDSGSNKKKANGVATRKTTPSARSAVRSSTKTWAVVLLLLVGLTSFAGYSYYQYTNTESARELLHRAELLKQGHDYQRALDIISNQLLERYPSSDVASTGRTLQSSIRTILNHEQRVRSDFEAINASVPPPRIPLPRRAV